MDDETVPLKNYINREAPRGIGWGGRRLLILVYSFWQTHSGLLIHYFATQHSVMHGRGRVERSAKVSPCIFPPIGGDNDTEPLIRSAEFIASLCSGVTDRSSDGVDKADMGNCMWRDDRGKQGVAESVGGCGGGRGTAKHTHSGQR